MTAATELRCALCGVRFRSTAEAETAHVLWAVAHVCADGYACAKRANGQRAGKTWLTVVTTPPVAQPHETVDEIK